MSPPSDGDGYRVNPLFEIRTGTSGVHGTLSGRDSRIDVTDPAVALVVWEAVEPRSRTELIERVAGQIGGDESVIGQTVDRLITDDVLVGVEQTRADYWIERGWLDALRFHLRTRTADGVSQGATAERTVSAGRVDTDEADGQLPAPAPLDASVRDSLLDRETCREFAGESVSARTVATVLAHGTSLVSARDRITATSDPRSGCFGATLVTLRVDGIDDGVYRYDPRCHDLNPVERFDASTTVVDDRIESALIRQSYARGAAFLVVITSNYEAIRSQFGGSRGLRGSYAALSMYAQRFLLAATAHGVATFQTGAYHNDELAALVDAGGFTADPEFVLAFGRASDE